MNPKMTVAVVMIVLGAVVLGYSGISFRSRGEPVDVLGVRIETTRRHFIPPVAGAIALAGGLVLLVMGTKKA
ncbi:MAG: DUF3185 domain-containing protein [Lentisphaerae bacterium]|nr:DUF3185 domain-containing protein [Lentisphaerota bacterium]